MLPSISQHSLTSIGKYLFLLGGYTGNFETKKDRKANQNEKVWIFDASTEDWRSIQPEGKSPTSFRGHRAACSTFHFQVIVPTCGLGVFVLNTGVRLAKREHRSMTLEHVCY